MRLNVSPSHRGSPQRGAALITSLLLLTVMTILGLSSLQTTKLQEEMVGNQRNRQIALDAGEAGLAAAERYIRASVATTDAFDTDGSDGLYDVDRDGDDEPEDELWKDVDWSDSGSNYREHDFLSSKSEDSDEDRIEPAANPRYVIEHIGSAPLEASDLDTDINLNNYSDAQIDREAELFRITVRALGGSERARVLLQTVFGKALKSDDSADDGSDKRSDDSSGG